MTFSKKVRSIDTYLGEYNLTGWKSRLYKELDPKPNWSSSWMLNSELTGSYEYTDNIEVYNAVAFHVTLIG